MSSTPLARICCVFALLAAACGSGSKANTTGKPDGALAAGGEGSGGAPAGSGATSGSGGTFASGGEPSSGGAVVSSGGTTSSGGAGTGGGAGASDGGGTLSPDGSAPPASCRTNADCALVAGTPLCEASTGKCIACHTNAQCSAKEECKNSVCTKLPACQNSLDCASAPGGKSICDKTNGVCVQCTVDADCGTGKVCDNRVCHVSCSTDNDCTAQHMLCNKGLGFNGECTQCIVASDCSTGEYCESGTCVPETCKPSQQSCDNNVVVQCNQDGSGTIPLTQCTLALFSYCVVNGDNAKCVGACENGVKDGLETDVDCGGPVCPRCAAGKACVLPTDCSSTKCTSSKCQ